MTDWPDDAATEDLVLAAFCRALPELQARAARGFWRDRLDMHVAEIAAGGSAVLACRELNLGTPADRATRGGDGGPVDGASTSWLPPPSVVGDYRCPLDRCARRADRDQQARPPRCGIADAPMRYVRRDTA